MSENKQLFILQNQDKYFLGKDNQWVDGTEPKDLFKTPHRDIAINHLFEVNAHDVEQRIQILACAIEGRSNPVIDPAIMPPPLPKPSPPEADEASADTPNLGSKSPIAIAESRSKQLNNDEGCSEHEEELLVQEN